MKRPASNDVRVPKVKKSGDDNIPVKKKKNTAHGEKAKEQILKSNKTKVVDKINASVNLENKTPKRGEMEKTVEGTSQKSVDDTPSSSLKKRKRKSINLDRDADSATQHNDASVAKKTKKARRKKHRKTNESDKKQKQAFDYLFVKKPKQENAKIEKEDVKETISEEKVRKEPKKKKEKKEDKKASSDPQTQSEDSKKAARDMAISYLRTWKADRKNWKFKKVQQIWLIKNMYDAEKIDVKNFTYLLQYLEGSKGGVRSRLLESAQKVHDSFSEAGPEDSGSMKLVRAKEVLQTLSE